MDRQQIENVKRIYTPGLVIILVKMAGEPSMPRGLKGPITHVNDMGLIHVRWEDGSGLTVDPQEDEFVLLQPVSGFEFLKQRFIVDEDTQLQYREYAGKNGYDRYVSASEFGKMLEGWIDEVLDGFLEDLSRKHKTEPVLQSLGYNTFLKHLYGTHEIDRHNPYIKISNLMRLKEYLKRPGAKIKILRHKSADMIGLTLQVTKAQTNGVYLHVLGDPEHAISQANGGRGRFMEFYKSKNYHFGDSVQVYGDGSQGLLSQFQVLPCHYQAEGDA